MSGEDVPELFSQGAMKVVSQTNARGSGEESSSWPMEEWSENCVKMDNSMLDP